MNTTARGATTLVAGALLMSVLGGCLRTGTHANTPSASAAPSASELFEHGVRLARAGDLLRSEQYLALAARAGYPEDQVLPWLLDLCLSASRYRAALNYAESYLDRHTGDHKLARLVRTIRRALWGRDPQGRIQLPRPATNAATGESRS